MAGRTRSRLNLTEKKEGPSVDSDSDSVIFIEESDIESTPVMDDSSDHEDDGEDEDKDDDEDDVSFTSEPDEDGERNEFELRMKRRKVNADENAVSVGGSVAKRTRSHYISKFGKLKSKQGTKNNPLCIDDDEEKDDKFESFSEQPDLSDSDGRKNRITRKRKATKTIYDSGESDVVYTSGDTDESVNLDFEADPRYFDPIKILLDSLCDKGEKLGSSSSEEGNNKKVIESKPEKEEDLDYLWSEMNQCLLFASEHESKSKQVRSLKNKKVRESKPEAKPENEVELDHLWSEMNQCLLSASEHECEPDQVGYLKNHKVTESKPEPKPENEVELDHLWSEMNQCLSACEHESKSKQVEDDEVLHVPCPSGNEVNRAVLCQRGEHVLKLDEEIGLVCKHCLHVSRDIKYCDPPFAKNSRRNSGRRYSYSSDDDDTSHLLNNGLRDQIFSCDADSCENDDRRGSTGTVWDILSSEVKDSMFPHQKEAFEFLWRNLAGGISLKELKKPLDSVPGSGCIISHAPGTGKTRLAIVFLQAFLELYPTCKPIIVAPSNMLLPWEEEFKKWKVDIPFHNLNNPNISGKETRQALGCLRERNKKRKITDDIRLVKLSSWKNDRSILGISYALFEKLAGESSNEKKDVNNIIKKALQETPGLLVLDEGHNPRNSRTLIWKALSKIQTKRRIILSGTPFQNNFSELYNTLCLVKPEFDEKARRESNKTGVELEHRLKYLFNSFETVKSVGEKNKILEKIRALIKPFVHLHQQNVLQESLHGMKEMVLVLKPTQLQKELLQDINHKRRNCLLRPLTLDHLESRIAVHPSLHHDVTTSNKLESERLNPDDGVKTKFLMKLIKHCESLKEKVLIFSQYVKVLNFLCELFESHFKWTEGKEILKMHGKHDVQTRQASIKAFNDPKSEVRLMLASTKACSEGISLVGASRVVLLDVVWNPSVDWQAVSRAYRHGQKKDVYTYHLITSGTRDEPKCCRQVEKDHLSKSVFYSDGHNDISSEPLKDKILESMLRSEDFKVIFEKIATNKRTLL